MKSTRKLRLNPDALRVEGFPTLENDRAPRGTVHGNQESAADCSAYSYCGCATVSESGPNVCLCCMGYSVDGPCATDPLFC
jgi:hypothetical protein